MRYLALATDGDGTLLRGGRISRNTLAALTRWRDDGRKLILVTGETAQQICDFPHRRLFDRIVAENGALLMRCGPPNERKLCRPPPAALLRALKQAGLSSLKRGKVILQADFKDEEAIEEVLKRLGIDWRIVRNRRDLMLLPSEISKATGLVAAVKDLGISPRLVVGVGDAENDGALLASCGLGVAVNNAVPKLKRRADYVLHGQYGKGIVELIDGLLEGRLGSESRRATG